MQRLREDPESFLATVQIGITVIGATAGAFGGAAFAEDVEPLVRSVPWLADYAREIAFAAVVGLIAYLSVVLGELVPKSLALRSSERYALLVARPLLFLSRAARPAVWLLAASSNLVLRLFGDSTTFTESRLSSEEVRHVVEEAARTGDVDPAAGEIASRALRFATLTAEDVMIHRRFLVSFPPEASIDEVRRGLVEAGHERAPILDPATEEAMGYVTWRDVTAAAVEKAAAPVRSIARRGYFVPDSIPAAVLLRELQRRHMRLAIVVDEHGGTVGIVTLLDLLEEVVGEMLGEHDPPAAARIRRQPDGTALVDGMVPVQILNREMRLVLPDDDRATTVGGLCALLAGGRIPEAGEEIPSPDGTLLVPAEVSPRRVRVVSVRPARTDVDRA